MNMCAFEAVLNTITFTTLSYHASKANMCIAGAE